MTAKFTVSKSATRQLLMTAAGTLLLLAALDVVVLHRLSEPPATDDDGVTTSKGQTERRTDLVWGTLFTVAGATLVAVGSGGMLTGRCVVELDEAGVKLRVAGPMSYVAIPWDDIVSVRSARDYGDDGHVPMPQLLIEVRARAGYPDALWGAVWEENVLRIDADGWETAAEEVAVRCELMLGRTQEGDYH
jgi:hypothetical protein